MKKSLIFSGLVLISVGAVSAPYFMGKGIKSEIDKSIEEMNKKGMTIENTTNASYLETTSNGKIIVNNSIDFIENIATNYANAITGKQLNVLISDLKDNEKKAINELLDGMEIEYSTIISNLDSKPVINGHISKLSNSFEKLLNKTTTDKNAILYKKIDDMTKNKKFAFTFKDSRLKIQDIQEEVAKDSTIFKVNLEGLDFGEKDAILKSIQFNLVENSEDLMSLNFGKANFNYDIKDSMNYTGSSSINNISLFAKNEIDLNLENLSTLSSSKTDNNRLELDFTTKIDKINLVNKSIKGLLNKIKFNFNANLDAKATEKLIYLDFSDKSQTVEKEMESALQDIVKNTPNLKLNINSKGMSLDGKELSTEVNANADFKLINIKDINEFQNIMLNPRILAKHLEGSFIKIEADEKASNSVAPILLSQGIKPVKSKKNGFNEVKATAKDGSIYINDIKVF